MNIKTNRLLIRKLTEEDWESLKEVAIDFEASTYAIYDHQMPTSDEGVKKLIQRFCKIGKFFAVCSLSEGKFMGYVCLNGENHSELDLGYSFNSLFQGKGYALEACKAITNYAFNTLKVERLTAGTAILNFPSCKLLDKLGFRKVGESTLAFRKTPEGKPIEFTGGDFVLEKNQWMKKEYTCDD
jgi:RimJ/RimL family protein N-acetyltransferase